MKASMAVVATRTLAAGLTLLTKDESEAFDAMDPYKDKILSLRTLKERA
jgi:hypothetical protein